MIEALPELVSDHLWNACSVLFRALAFVALLPAFGGARLPVRVQMATALCLTVIVFPIVSHELPDLGWQGTDLLFRLSADIVTGACLGLLLRCFLFCLQIAGSIAGQSTSLSQIYGSAGSDPLPAIGHTLTMAGLTLALILGLHVQIVAFFVSSYQWMPGGSLTGFHTLFDTLITQLSAAFQLAFAIAAPFYIVSLLYNLTLGIINRAMPQLMVAFVGAPVITAGALIILMASLPVMLLAWHAAFEAVLNGSIGRY